MPGHTNCYEKSDTPMKQAEPRTIQELLLLNTERMEKQNNYDNEIITQLAEFFHEANRTLVEDYPEMMISRPVKPTFITWDKLTEKQRAGAIVKAAWIFKHKDVMFTLFRRY